MEEVLEMTELTRLQHSIVGEGDGGHGLSTEQRKRLSIGVELVAAPAVMFLECASSSPCPDGLPFVCVDLQPAGQVGCLWMAAGTSWHCSTEQHETSTRGDGDQEPLAWAAPPHPVM